VIFLRYFFARARFEAFWFFLTRSRVVKDKGHGNDSAILVSIVLRGNLKRDTFAIFFCAGQILGVFVLFDKSRV